MFRAHSKRPAPGAGGRQPARRVPLNLRRIAGRRLAPVILGALLATACDSGLAPPDLGPDGAIAGTVTYVGDWPPPESVVDLRFVALRFIPEDTTDFLQLNRMEVSETLRYGVAVDTFFIGGVAPGVFPFSGVARQATQDIFSWRPIGLYEEDDGLVEVAAGETVVLRLIVDFDDPPDFP